MSEMFKPKQFDSFEKVPEDQKSNFKKEEDGSFVYNEAAQELSDAELTAEIANKPKEQGITSMDVLKKKAKDEQKRRQIIIKDIKEGNVNEKKCASIFLVIFFDNTANNLETIRKSYLRQLNDIAMICVSYQKDSKMIKKWLWKPLEKMVMPYSTLRRS